MESFLSVANKLWETSRDKWEEFKRQTFKNVSIVYLKIHEVGDTGILLFMSGTHKTYGLISSYVQLNDFELKLNTIDAPELDTEFTKNFRRYMRSVLGSQYELDCKQYIFNQLEEEAKSKAEACCLDTFC